MSQDMDVWMRGAWAGLVIYALGIGISMGVMALWIENIRRRVDKIEKWRAMVEQSQHRVRRGGRALDSKWSTEDDAP